MIGFEYYAPKVLKEALSILSSSGDKAKVLAGGTDLIVQMKIGKHSPCIIVDAKSLPELNHLDCDDHILHIGAAVPLNKVVEFPPVRQRFVILQQGCSLIGSRQLRNRATVGGNICNAAPSADSAPPLLCLGATVCIARPGSVLKVPLESFFLGPGQTIIKDDELLMEVEVPVPGTQWTGCYLRHTPRHEMDISVAGVAVLLKLDKKENRCLEARIALGSVAPTPMRVPDAEAALTGQIVTSSLIKKAAEVAAKAARPISDVRASAGYRIELVKVLSMRAIQACLKTE
ncbi:MAG: xanthine dehydrogenase family protein subunit M [Dehalococcoidia bacterium]|jgi:carbon-monoxide dehydrogenase medium subunit